MKTATVSMHVVVGIGNGVIIFAQQRLQLVPGMLCVRYQPNVNFGWKADDPNARQNEKKCSNFIYI
jgi:hypothetical protein